MRAIYIFFAAGLFLFFSCQKSDYSPDTYANESTIYSDNASTNFREILLIIKPYLWEQGQKQYIVTDTIKNIRIKINGQEWGVFNSLAKDTASFNYQAADTYMLTPQTVKYSIIAPVGYHAPDTLTTAGEYADLLNAYFTLAPGFYLCEIDAFDIKLNNGNIQTVNPLITEAIEIEAGMNSVFLGEFEVSVN